MIVVECTTILVNYFAENQLNLSEFSAIFSAWKEQGGQDNFYQFGKDSAYILPKIGGKNHVLRHVHLVPVLNMQALNEWNRKWKIGARRTSDNFLVYVEDNNRFLLIAILPEPTAHEISRMQTPQDKKLMELFARIADEYIYNQRIIA